VSPRLTWKKTPAGREPQDPRMQAIVAALREGKTYREVAEEFGISTARVAEIREYAGLERRRRPRE